MPENAINGERELQTERKLLSITPFSIADDQYAADQHKQQTNIMSDYV